MYSFKGTYVVPEDSFKSKAQIFPRCRFSNNKSEKIYTNFIMILSLLE